MDRHPGMRMARGRAAGFAILLAAIVAAGCTSAPADPGPPVITTAPSGLRTFVEPSEINGLPIVCNAFSLGDGAVLGTLHVTPGAAETTWLEDPDGRHLSLAWSSEFTLAPAPERAIHDTRGERVAADGAFLRISQTPPEAAAGTPDDPYLVRRCDLAYE